VIDGDNERRLSGMLIKRYTLHTDAPPSSRACTADLSVLANYLMQWGLRLFLSCDDPVHREHLSSIAPELISKADVLKDIVYTVCLRENIGKGDSILSEKEIELVIRTLCTD